MQRIKPYALLTGVALIGVAVTGLAQNRERPSVGAKAPEFKAETIRGSKNMHFPKDFQGKLVLVDFWATWCPPCRAEIPHLVEVYKELHGDDFEVIGLSLDAPRVPEKKVEDFLKRNNMAWPQVYEEAGKIAREYGVSSIPSAFLVDTTTGKVVATDDALRGSSLKQTLETELEKFRKAKDKSKGNGK